MSYEILQAAVEDLRRRVEALEGRSADPLVVELRAQLQQASKDAAWERRQLFYLVLAGATVALGLVSAPRIIELLGAP